MFELALLVVIVTSVWVYFDARSIGAGPRRSKGFFDMGPAGWFGSCLLLWIVAFPAYLVKRQGYRRVHQASPEGPEAGQYRKCPFCAEMIRSEAIKCRHCGSTVEPIQQQTMPPQGVEGAASEHLAGPAEDDPGPSKGISGVGLAALILGLGSVVMPYFAAVFLIPAAAVCAVIALKRGQKGLGVAGIVLALIGLLSILFVSRETNQIIKDPFAPNILSSSPPVVTLSEYERIREGMAYADVTAIIGSAGQELSRSELAGYTTVMYMWTNPNGSNMNAMFQNGRLVTKAQFGLR